MTIILNGIIVSLAIGAFAGIFYASVVWRRREVDGSLSFIILLIGASIWAFGYALELASPALSHRIFYAKLQYLGIVAIPGAFTSFAIQYTSSQFKSHSLKNRQWLLLIHPLITLVLVWTYPLHHMVWLDVSFCKDCVPVTAYFQPGPWYWINVAYSYGNLIYGSLILGKAMRDAPEQYRKHALLLGLAFLAPWISNMMYMAGIRPLQFVDLTPLSFLIVAFALGRTFMHIGDLIYAPFVQQRVAETFPDAYFFIDSTGKVEDCNEHALTFVKANRDEIIASSAHQLIPGLTLDGLDFSKPVDYTDQIAWNGREVLAISDISSHSLDTIVGFEKYFNVKITPMHIRSKRFIGNLIVLTDVTTQLTSHWETMASNAQLEQSVSERTSELETINLQMRMEITKRTAMQKSLASLYTELTTLHTVGRAVADRSSLKQIADRAVVGTRLATETNLVMIYVREDDDFDFLSADFSNELRSEDRDLTDRIGEIFGRSVCDSGTAIFTRDITAEPWHESATIDLTGLHSFAALPLRSGQELIGLLVVSARDKRDFSAHAEFLESMAVEISLGMHNADLFEQSQRQLEKLSTEIAERRRIENQLKMQNLQLTTLNRITVAMSRELETDKIMQAVLDELVRFPGIEAAWLHTKSVTNSIALIPSTSAISPDHIPTLISTYDDDIEAVMTSGETKTTLLTINPESGKNAMALLMVPLIARDNVVGALSALCTLVDLNLEDSQALLESAGYQIALGLENVQLHLTAAQIEISEEVDRLRSDLIANVSHEIRTPLGLIKLFATMLQMRDQELPPAERYEFLESIESEANILEELVSDLLGLSRYDAGQLILHWNILDLRDIVKDVIDSMHLELVSRKLSIIPWPQALMVNADSFRLQQVVRNLLSNAIKYSPDDTTITIRMYVDGNDAVVSVQDQGIGIPVDLQPRVFERFFRADNTPPHIRGVGLGLAISKIIAETHKGQLWFDSTPGHGSIFYLSLPVVPDL